MLRFGGREDGEGSPGTPPAEWEVVRSGPWRGQALEARFDTAFRGDRAVAVRFPHWTSITALLQDPRVDGMPKPSETARLAELEQFAFASVQEAGDAVLVGAVTTNGRHELMIYAASAEAARAHFQAIRETAPGQVLELIVMEDTGWEVYRQFVS